jgi:hypothetical protein
MKRPVKSDKAANDPALNYLPIVKGWTYTVRLYRPRKEILDGRWKSPERNLYGNPKISSVPLRLVKQGQQGIVLRRSDVAADRLPSPEPRQEKVQ